MSPGSEEPRPGDSRAIRALFTVAVLAHVLRLLASLAGADRAWGLDEGRFLGWPGFASAWSLTLAVAIGIRSALGAGLERAIGRFSSWRGATILCGLAGAVLVLLLPDRTRWLGDAFLREEAAVRGDPGLFPQMTPGDAWWHLAVPHVLGSALGLGAPLVIRLQGALAAASLFALAWIVSSRLAREPMARLALTLLLAFEGVLAACTGYSKGLQTAAVASLVFTGFGTMALRRSRSNEPWPEIALAVGLLMHRAMLVLLPAHAFLLFVSARSRGGPGTSRTRWLAAVFVWLACGLPAVGRVLAFDPAHNLGAGATGGALATMQAALVSPTRWLDLANALLAVAPAVVLLPLLLRARPAAGEQRFLGLSAVPWIGILVLAPPALGVFRFLDVSLPLSAVLTWTVAVGVARVADSSPRAGRALVSLALLVSVFPMVIHLQVQSNPAAGIPRLAAQAAAAWRPDAERGEAWEFVGTHAQMAGAFGDAAKAHGEAARLTPSYRRTVQWGLAAMEAGDWTAAHEAFAEAVRRSPASAVAWTGRLAAARRTQAASVADSARNTLDSLARTPRGMAELGLVRSSLPMIAWALADSGMGGPDTAGSNAPAPR